MNSRSSIVLIGAAHIDRCGRCFDFPQQGKSNPGRFTDMPGGAAFNVASNLAAMGTRPTVLSITGKDESAAELARVAKARGVILDCQISNAHPTATYTSIVAPDGDLALALADMSIYEDFDATPILSKLQSRSSNDWLLIDANLPAAALSLILDVVECRVAAMATSVAKCTRLKNILPSIDIVFANRSELATLLDLPADSPLDDLGTSFHKKGGIQAIVTDGEKDVWTTSTNNVEQQTVEPIKNIVDVTGAGDGFTAACLLGLMYGNSLSRSIGFGIAAARAILAVEGPWRADLITVVGDMKQKNNQS